MDISYIERKSLLYKTGVEYGDWTINHIQGCMHGCNFPCYAFLMAKRFGRAKTYQDRLKIKIVSNSVELLDKEINKYKNEIDFVHLCFTTDPFMYNSETKNLVPEIKDITLKVIKRLNKSGIKVTTLTKGLYPEELLNKEFLGDNEYGITLVSLTPEFHKQYEPYSSPYTERVKSLKKLHDKGLKTRVSIEPYPTPLLDKDQSIDKLLKTIGFVDKIIFGRLNYNAANSAYPKAKEFYEENANKVIAFCKKNGIEYHIKEGTQKEYKKETSGIFK